MATRDAATRARFYRRLSVALGIVVVILGIVVTAQALATGAAPEATESGSPAAAGEESVVVRRADDDPMAVGEVDAPVVLVMWTDLRCPYCAIFERDTLPVIVDEYVDTGKVRIEVHDVAFFGEQSEDAAVAARAAGEQGRFFEYLAAVYADAPENAHPELPRDTLIAFAETAGVPDIARFTADLDDAGLHEASQQSTTDAQRLGVSSVPFFLAGDTVMAGAQPVSTFREYLDAALAESG